MKREHIYLIIVLIVSSLVGGFVGLTMRAQMEMTKRLIGVVEKLHAEQARMNYDAQVLKEEISELRGTSLLKRTEADLYVEKMRHKILELEGDLLMLKGDLLLQGIKVDLFSEK